MPGVRLLCMSARILPGYAGKPPGYIDGVVKCHLLNKKELEYVSLRRKWAAMLMAAWLLLGMAGALAEEPLETPLETLLARVPEAAFSWDYLSYADIAALTGGVPGGQTEGTGQGASGGGQALQDSDRMRAYQNISAGFADFHRSLRMPIRDSLGIDPLAVTQSMEMGLAPDNQGWLQGQWSAAEVEVALRGKGHAPTSEGKLPLWCPDGDCGVGYAVDLEQRDPAFIFGGALGSRWPIAWDETVMAGSRNAAAMQLIAAQEAPSLLDSARMQMLLGNLAQSDTQDTGRLGLVTQLIIRALPPGEGKGGPTHIAVAQVEDATQRVNVALLLPDTEAAAAWGTRLTQELPDAVLERTSRPLMQMVAERGGAMDVLRTGGMSNGEGLLLLPFRYDIPPETAPDGAQLLFALFAQAIHMQDLGWLGL